MERELVHKQATRIAPAAAADVKTEGGGSSGSGNTAANGTTTTTTTTTATKPAAKNGHAPTAAAGPTTATAAADGHASTASHGETRTPKKRRKVNHACVYCRRSHMTCDLERPCTRCIKRNIGHLCHDEPRDSESKKSKTSSVGVAAAHSLAGSDAGTSTTTGAGAGAAGAGTGAGAGASASHLALSSAAGDESDDYSAASLDKPAGPGVNMPASLRTSSFDAVTAAAAAAAAAVANPLQLVRPKSGSGIQANGLSNDVSQFGGFSDAWLSANHYHDMNVSNYMIVPEVSGELQFLNDFLQSSMVDDAAYVSDDQSNQLLRSAPPDVATNFLTSGSAATGASDSKPASSGGLQMEASALKGSSGGSGAATSGANKASLGAAAAAAGSMAPPPDRNAIDAEVTATSPAMTRLAAVDKAREYYMQAADPSGNDTPEQRMSALLKAKYDAGLLKPFNYVKGYTRLHNYLDSHKISPASKQKIQRQLDRFRPKFREKMQALTDLELIYVEMWFEKTLMEYDRVFASMAVPACCWRRTGEIFRGNKEMAELIGVPVESLRDGKIAIHEILTEESMVRYWEEFGTIAFDSAHDTLLTACSIKSIDDDDRDDGASIASSSAMASKSGGHEIIKCCFSLKIRRDDHKIPSLIIGNFLPHDPLPH